MYSEIHQTILNFNIHLFLVNYLAFSLRYFDYTGDISIPHDKNGVQMIYALLRDQMPQPLGYARET